MIPERLGGADQDENPIPTRDRSLCGVWIALEDATVDNGALWVIKDSHRDGVIFDRKPHELPSVDSMAQAVGFDHLHKNAMVTTQQLASLWLRLLRPFAALVVIVIWQPKEIESDCLRFP